VNSNGLQFQLSSPFEARVIQQDGAIKVVDLRAGTCTCREYQINDIPCGHALKAIFASNGKITDYLPRILSTETWQATYATPMPVVDITNLQPHDDEPCNPPKTRIPRGRPKKKREERATFRASRGLRAEDVEVGEDGGPVLGADGLAEGRKNLCKTCGQPGHIARTCTTPHV
jgi:hypothetical protein